MNLPASLISLPVSCCLPRSFSSARCLLARTLTPDRQGMDLTLPSAQPAQPWPQPLPCARLSSTERGQLHRCPGQIRCLPPPLCPARGTCYPVGGGHVAANPPRVDMAPRPLYHCPTPPPCTPVRSLDIRGAPPSQHSAPPLRHLSGFSLLLPPGASSLGTGTLTDLFVSVPPAPRPVPLQGLLHQYLGLEVTHLQETGPSFRPHTGFCLVDTDQAWPSLFLQLSTHCPAPGGPGANPQQTWCVAGLKVPAGGQGFGLASSPQWTLGVRA